MALFKVCWLLKPTPEAVCLGTTELERGEGVTHKGFVGFINEPVVEYSEALVPPDPHKLHDRQEPTSGHSQKQLLELQKESSVWSEVMRTLTSLRWSGLGRYTPWTDLSG